MFAERVVISAPFGNWFCYPGAIPTRGTFTLSRRGGFLKRLWRCLLTLRYSRKAGGWINRLGLPNPGVASLPLGRLDGITSLHALSSGEWLELVHQTTGGYLGGMMTLAVDASARRFCDAIEFNLSCPNMGAASRRSVREIVQAAGPAIRQALMTIRSGPEDSYQPLVIAKLPPVNWLEMARDLFGLGVTCFHCCNTMPIPGGGLSGKALKQYSLLACADLKAEWGDAIKVIGGGGITSMEDVRDYVGAGADRIAIGSMLLNPFCWGKARRLCAEAVQAWA